MAKAKHSGRKGDPIRFPEHIGRLRMRLVRYWLALRLPIPVQTTLSLSQKILKTLSVSSLALVPAILKLVEVHGKPVYADMVERSDDPAL